MVAAMHAEVRDHLRLHRLAVQLFQTSLEQYGIEHEQTALALRLVEMTNPGDTDVAVLVAGAGNPEG